MKATFRLPLLLIFLLYTAECRLNAPLSAQRQSPDRKLKKGKGTIVVKEDVIIEDQCEIVVSMVMPNFADYTVGGQNDVESLGINLVERSNRDEGAFFAANITDAKVSVQKVAPIDLEQRRLSEPRNLAVTKTKRSWSWNSVKFQASINRCRWCNPDNSDQRFLQIHNLEDDNWFAYKYLRSIQQSSDWLDDATYLRVQADCETLQLDGTYDESNEEQRIRYASVDDEDYSSYKVVDRQHDEI